MIQLRICPLCAAPFAYAPGPQPERSVKGFPDLTAKQFHCFRCGRDTWHDAWTVYFYRDRVGCHECGAERQIVEPFTPRLRPS